MNNSFVLQKTFLIMGLGRTGISTAHFLLNNGASIILNDGRPDHVLANQKDFIQLLEKGVPAYTGNHPFDILFHHDIDYIIKSPGIPYDLPFLEKAKSLSIPIINDIELSYLLNPCTFIGITGSNGKTTTTTLANQFLQSCYHSVAAGNIGIPICEQLPHMTPASVFVTELSSFQLLDTHTFRPKIGVLLNLHPSHLDFHHSKESYYDAKSRLFQNQTQQDILIYNADQEDVLSLVAGSVAQKIPFSTKKRLEFGAYIWNDYIYVNETAILSIQDIRLLGSHNLENILASVLIAYSMQVPFEHMKQVLQQFSGVPHRLEFIENIQNRFFYNDSKSTNETALLSAIRSFHTPTVLLVGGKDRGDTFASLSPYVGHIKHIVTFGETRHTFQKLSESWGIPCTVVQNVAQATKEAFSASKETHTILFSPGCASWDQYQSFEERGFDFIHSVKQVKEYQK